ncbi:DUF4974 domain-containing protein [Niastella caeni]|uniref:DUF4974 domain-containing protein n=1 Tax=Niastella caeni TaxID=2569763 RepID=A0A4S8HZM9_9BACT|nr:FecR domain-containing protein [Niastella caeni]THU39644.1 DUF4974 domain-containing protein [Niastella caeni]
MSVDTDRIQYLFRLYTQKVCTREELQELFAFIAQPENRAVLEQLMDAEYDVLQPLATAPETDWEHLFIQATQTVNDKVYPLNNSNRFRWARVAAAAVIVLIAGLGGYSIINRLAKNNVAKNNQPVQQPIEDALPGGDKAVLTLADGSTIPLQHAQDGLLSKQGHVEVIKNKNGEVEYRSGSNRQLANGNEQAAISWNMLATPKGGQYQLVLPDGSKVWLNAASSIRYPVAFAGDERRVEITGEVYFEVSHLPARRGVKGRLPFIVNINGKAEVEVLGTHFNVSAYDDEEAVKTTLLEGKVKIASSEWQVASGKTAPDHKKHEVILQPGEQAVLTAHSLLTTNHSPDIELAMAWKNGLTAFKSADLKSIMRQVARWYNIEVVYEGNLPQRRFTGGISRNARLTELLRLLEVSRVRFRFEKNKLIVSP